MIKIKIVTSDSGSVNYVTGQGTANSIDHKNYLDDFASRALLFMCGLFSATAVSIRYDTEINISTYKFRPRMHVIDGHLTPAPHSKSGLRLLGISY